MKFFEVKNLNKYQHYKDRRPPWIKLHASLLDDYEFARLADTHKAHLMLIWVLASQSENKLPVDPEWVGRRIGANDPVDLDALMDAGFLVPYSGEQPESGWGSRYIPKETKEEVFSRDRGRCVACGSDENIEYDHRIPISKGGDSSIENLQLLCRSCNRAKRVRSAGSAPAEHGVPVKRSPETERETKKRQTRVETEVAPVAGLDEGAWQRWCEYRLAIRKPLKPASIEAAQKQLAAFGPDQLAVVEQSIANGWQGLFALKDQKGGSHAPRQGFSAVDRVRQATTRAVIDGEYERKG